MKNENVKRTPWTLEMVRDAIAAYIIRPDMDGRTILDFIPGFGRIYGVGELASKVGVPAHLVGKIRRNFKKALAQAITPGGDSLFEVTASMLYGKTAITVRRRAAIAKAEETKP